MQINEVMITAPWGHIAAKLWGEEDNEAVIITHGLLDNAGSFDTLIPHLPKTFYYICVDLPGHGLSSSFHFSLPLHTTNYLVAYKIVFDYFKRKKYILMGHSFGGGISANFAQLYPQYISKLILLDIFYIPPLSPKEFMDRILLSHEVLFKTLNNNSERRPKYSYNDAVDKVWASRILGKISREVAENITRRMLLPVEGDKYMFTIDPRLKAVVALSSTLEYFLEMFERRPIKCPVLITVCPNNIYIAKVKPLRRYFEELGFKLYDVDGDHYVHCTKPHLVSSLIANFMLQNVSKL